MNFSECFKVSQRQCKFSPNGEYVASCVQYRLIVRDAESLEIKSLQTCLDNINLFEWSPDSCYIFCMMLKRGVVQVWSLDDPEWTCKIAQGACGLATAYWSPDSRHILTTADFQLRITVWSLLNKSASYIKFPKHSNKGLSFSKDGLLLALAERHNTTDFISIFSSSGWSLLKHFETKTNDLSDLSWSPSNTTIAVWDSCLEYSLLLYGIDGHLLSSFSAYQFALGIKSVSWSPDGKLLAIGSYDQSVRLLNSLTWRQIVEHKHPSSISTYSVVIYKEVLGQTVTLPWDTKGERGLPSASHYEVVKPNFQLPYINPDSEKPNPRLGVGTVAFSADSKYMATRNDNMPTVVWIWDVNSVCLAFVLVQCHPIKALQWDPLQSRLAICSGTNKLYLWSPAGCLAVNVPADVPLNVSTLQWNQDGTSIVLVGKEHWCICTLANNNDKSI